MNRLDDQFAKENCGISPSMFSTESWMKKVRFRVPLYQRLFVWEDDQMTQLLEDLAQASKRPQQNYFIGTLTVYRKVHENETWWELVDGQQRMTVITLLGACCRPLGGNSCWDPFIFWGNAQESRVQYFTRPEDQRDLDNICRHGLVADNVANLNMKVFLKVFHRFKEKIKKDGLILSEFAEFVCNRTTALVAFLPDKYKLNDLNFYFEMMNATGKQLEAHEILKVKFFSRHCTKWNAIADGSKRFEALSGEKPNDARPAKLSLKQILDDPQSVNFPDEPSGNLPASEDIRLVVSFPVFLLHTLAILLDSRAIRLNLDGKSFWDTKHLISIFKKAQEDWGKEDFAEAFVKEMGDYREWMDKWIIHLEYGLPSSPYLKGTRNLASYVVGANKKPVWQFQAMLYVSGDERQKWVLETYKEFRKNKASNSTYKLEVEKDEFLLAILKRMDWEKHKSSIPEKETLEKFSYGKIDRYWFWKLDYILWEKVIKGELNIFHKIQGFPEQKWISAVKSYTFRRNRSIEHLHPQTSEKKWGEKDLHSFGNLAMISASFNSKQGNDSVGIKFGRMSDQEGLESIKLLLMFITAEGKDYFWDRDKAEKHCQEMVKHLLSGEPKISTGIASVPVP